MTILRDVGDSLKALLQPNISGLQTDSIIFDSPAAIDATGLTSVKLSVYLYQVVHNNFLRNMEPQPVGLDKLQYPPLALDLHYLFTPYAGDRETELIVMEQLLQTLHDHSIMRGTDLKGNLTAGGNNEIRLVPNALSLEEMNKLWGMFPNKPFKLTAAYVATPVRIPSGKPDMAIKRVLQKNISLAQE